MTLPIGQLPLPVNILNFSPTGFPLGFSYGFTEVSQWAQPSVQELDADDVPG